MFDKMKKYIIVFILSLLFSVSYYFGLNLQGVLSFIFLFFIFYLIIYFLFDRFINFRLSFQKEKINHREFIFYSIIILVPMLIALIAYYPGIFDVDAMTQINHLNSDWHPYFQSLIFIRLPYKLFNSYVSITLFQIIFIYLVMLYVVYFLRRNFLNFKATILALIVMCLNPCFIKISVIIWKDVSFSCVLLISILCVIDIILSDGKWINSLSSKIIFILSFLGVVFFRHNGITSFIVALLCLAICYKNKRVFYISVLVIITLLKFLWSGPIVSYLDYYPNGGKTEMVGLVLGQISCYYNNDVSFSEEELLLLQSMLPLDTWKQNYVEDNFNYIKWADNSLVSYMLKDDHNFDLIMRMHFEKSIQNPNLFFMSFKNFTKLAWESGTSHEYRWYYSEVTDTFLGLDELQGQLETLVDEYFVIVDNTPFRFIFLNISGSLFVIIALLIIKFCKVKKFKYLIPYIIVLAYSLPLILLITGGERRFFYPQLFCLVPLVIYTFSNVNVKHNN